MDEMTNRDLFAMAALQGMLSGPTMVKAEDLVKFSYTIADAMLDYREKGPKLTEAAPEGYSDEDGNEVP